MDEKKSAPAEIETVTITMNRPVAEAVAKACEMYLRLHLGQFEDLIDELCMAKFYAALENDSLPCPKTAQRRRKYRMLRGACAHCTPPPLEARRVTAALVSTRAFFLISPSKWQRLCMSGK